MNNRLDAHELTQVSSELGIDTFVLDEHEAKQYITRVLDIFKPFRITGHLWIGEETLTIPLEGNDYEFSYSKYLNSEPAYIFFDQKNSDRNSVVVVKDAKLLGTLFENAYGMEYFVSNEKMDFLLAVNWYVIEVAGSAKELLGKLAQK